MRKTREVYALKRWQYALVRLVLPLYRLWGWTLRISISKAHLANVQTLQEPAVFILWHNRLFCAPFLVRKYLKKTKLAGLVSASKDGAWLAALFQCVGVKAIRGSSSFRGSASLKEIFKAMDKGWSIALTPDGPRGPCYSMAKGMLLIAQKTSRPIVLCSWRYTKAWRLPSWDGFYLPKPFSTVEVQLQYYPNYEALMQVAQNEELEAYLQQQLLALGKDQV